MEAFHKQRPKKNVYECLFTKYLTVQGKGIIHETHWNILSSQSHHGCKVFLSCGSAKYAQCGKTTELNSAKGQRLFLHPPTQYMHTHACSVCIQCYKSKVLEYIIILLSARCFSYCNTRNYGEIYLPLRVKRRCLRKQNFCHRSHVQVRRQFWL